MPLFRKAPEPPSREPHPDPVTETQLQQLLALKRAAARQENVAAAYLAEIQAAHDEQDEAAGYLRNHNYHDAQVAYDRMIKAATERAVAAQRQLTVIEAEVARLYQEIAERTATLDPNDRAYL